MILGRGCAQTDAAIIAEYHEFLQKVGHITIPKNLVTIKASPKSMLRAIKKPVREWSDDDILELVRARKLASRYKYNVFLAFLFFRGYRQPSLYLLEELHIDLGHQWGPVVAPYREKVDQAAKELGRPKAKQVTHLLLMLLVNQGKALEQVSRADFEAFRDEYQMRYRLKRRKGQPDPRLYSLEQYLIHWGIFAPAPVVFRYEEHFSMLIHDSVRHALSFYMTWAAAKYDRSSLTGQRRALQLFFCWLQEHYPQAGSLHEVTRSIAIDYSRYLTDQAKANVYGKTYIHDLYQIVRRFFLFALDERVDEHLSHNPFMLKDISSKEAYPVPRYLSDQEIKAVLAYCEGDATLLEKVVVTLLLHTGVRVAELAMLKASDMVQIGGTWKLHIHEGKGLKDRVIPLTACCVELLQAWQNDGWERANNFLFTHYGRPSQHGASMSTLLRKIGLKVGVIGLTAHRFRHTFAVALLNYGIRETALQKLMGHATLGMTLVPPGTNSCQGDTRDARREAKRWRQRPLRIYDRRYLEYARILDHTVEQSFTEAVSQMQEAHLSWVPNFFLQEDYTLFVEGDAVSWIRLPLGYCRRNAKLHCESDVKCLLCDRFAVGKEDLPRLQQMYERFTKLGLKVKADVVAAQIQRLELPSGDTSRGFIPVQAVATRKRSEE